MERLFAFAKKEIVLVISFVLCVVSMLFVTPNSGYLDYIDFRTLILLFCLMAVMSGLNGIGVFKVLATKLLSMVHTVASVVLILVLMCFVGSMIITNDVALITFVPFTVITLKLAAQSHKLIFVVTLQTIAANLGSMLTPIGNPQNLYLFSRYNMSISDFVYTIFPYAILSFVLLVVFSFLSGSERIALSGTGATSTPDIRLLCLYIALFVLCLLGVFRVLNFVLLFAVVVISVLIFDRKTLVKVDYSLLLTFVFLFVFIGNLGAIDSIRAFLFSVVTGYEVIAGILSSQVISNVPAAILLSGFTNNAKDLLIGVNLGGLGTLIASMASLISFKIVAKESISTAKYMLMFTVLNIIFLGANLLLYQFIR